MFKKKQKEEAVSQQEQAQTFSQPASNIKIVTSQDLGDLHFDVIDGIAVSYVKARNMFSQMGAGFKASVGGHLGSFEKLYDTMRGEVLIEMQNKALAMGANAIIALRIDVNELARLNGIAMFGYGTAVRIKDPSVDAVQTSSVEIEKTEPTSNNNYDYEDGNTKDDDAANDQNTYSPY